MGRDPSAPRAFVLAQAGLLNGRQATTHWSFMTVGDPSIADYGTYKQVTTDLS